MEKLAERNREWIGKNKRVFMLVLDPLSETESVIGYSSILPLTAEGIKSYLNGALKDADIPTSLVAGNIDSTAAILIFAIHLRKQFSATGTTPFSWTACVTTFANCSLRLLRKSFRHYMFKLN